MKNVLLLSIIIFMVEAFVKEPSIDRVRLLYQQSVTNEASCKELISILSPFNETNNPLYSGYKASATMVMAKHVFNPFSKMSYFKNGKNMLEKAIAADQKNIELRFLRFNAQTNMPSFLGYHDQIETDKKLIINSFSQITDLKLRQFIRGSLNRSKYLSDEEKLQLE